MARCCTLLLYRPFEGDGAACSLALTGPNMVGVTESEPPWRWQQVLMRRSPRWSWLPKLVEAGRRQTIDAA